MRRPLKVVVAGGGVGGLEALVALRGLAADAVDLQLIAPDETFSLRALTVLEPFGSGRPRDYPLADLARDLDATLRRDAVAAVHPERRRVTLRSGEEIAYDALVLAVGARTYPAYGHGVMFERATEADAFDELLDDLRTRLADDVVIVVPPGATWTLPAYELALLTAAGIPGAHVTLVTPEPEPLAAFGPPASAMARAELAHAGVAAITGTVADVVGHGVVRLGAGRRLIADRIVHLPLLVGPRVPGVACDELGFTLVDGDLRVAGRDDVFAIGDGTASALKQGGVAAQQAGVVASMLAARAGAQVRVEPLRPVLRGLLRTARGPRYLRAAGDEALVSEQPLWWPPSKVASRWLVPWLAARDLEGRAARVLPSGGIVRRRLREPSPR
jgi:sulfide:quinone oxidoreductase